jgi:Ala-tRNA(Pro) deacylase
MKPAIRSSLFLDDQEVHFETVIHPPAYTAQRLAKHLHVSGRQVAKSVLLVCPGGYYVAVLPATHRIDFAAVGQALGRPARLARDEEIAGLFNDCEHGTLSPFGGLYGISTLLDDSFAPGSQMVFEAQRHSLAIRMRCQDFERVERPRRFKFATCIN